VDFLETHRIQAADFLEVKSRIQVAEAFLEETIVTPTLVEEVSLQTVTLKDQICSHQTDYLAVVTNNSQIPGEAASSVLANNSQAQAEDSLVVLTTNPNVSIFKLEMNLSDP
jgi:hypothetical protein